MYTLYIGNKNYSTWSLRAWVLMKALAIAFEERQLALYEPDTSKYIRRVSPSGRVPCLHDGEVVVWDSLAILEYLAERHPQLTLIIDHMGLNSSGGVARARDRKSMGTLGGCGDAFRLCASPRRVGNECEIAIGQDAVCSGGVRDRAHRRLVAGRARALRSRRGFSLRPVHGSRRVLLPGRVPISNLRRSTRRCRRRLLPRSARVTRNARMGCGCGH